MATQSGPAVITGRTRVVPGWKNVILNSPTGESESRFILL